MKDTTALKITVILVLGIIEMTLCIQGMGLEYLPHIITALLAVLGISYAVDRQNKNSNKDT